MAFFKSEPRWDSKFRQVGVLICIKNLRSIKVIVGSLLGKLKFSLFIVKFYGLFSWDSTCPTVKENRLIVLWGPAKPAVETTWRIQLRLPAYSPVEKNRWIIRWVPAKPAIETSGWILRLGPAKPAIKTSWWINLWGPAKPAIGTWRPAYQSAIQLEKKLTRVSGPFVQHLVKWVVENGWWSFGQRPMGVLGVVNLSFKRMASRSFVALLECLALL